MCRAFGVHFFLAHPVLGADPGSGKSGSGLARGDHGSWRCLGATIHVQTWRLRGGTPRALDFLSFFTQK